MSLKKKNKASLWINLLANLFIVSLMVWLWGQSAPPRSLLLPALMFGLVITFFMSFSIVLAKGMASLSPLATLVSYIVLGPALTGWLLYLGVWVHGLIRWYFGERLGTKRPSTVGELVNLSAWNAASNTASILLGGSIALWLSTQIGWPNRMWMLLFELGVMALIYFAANHLLNLFFLWLFQPENTRTYLSQVPTALVYEGVPLLIAPFMIILLEDLGWWYFLFPAALLAAFSLITHNLDRTRQRLERRVRELHSLRVVGQTLRYSLDLEELLNTIYEQVCGLMPADTFYVALVDPRSGLISFPFFIKEGVRIEWPARPPRNGLTEYILQTRRPLLVQQDLDQRLAELRLDQIGELAASWLGVPVMVGEEVLGVLSVQSIPQANVFDSSHQELLMLIAGQAALAIRNARLYTETHTSLAQRLQELDLIFRTTEEGILLLNREWQMLAVNHAFARFVGLIGIEPERQSILEWPPEGEAIISRLGYSPVELETDCVALLAENERTILKKHVEITGIAGSRNIERALTPVLDAAQHVSGWLLVLRDVTEEVALSQFREDMMQMMVHDLRAPLSILLGSVEAGQEHFARGDAAELPPLLDMARNNGTRMMSLINNMLDIYQLEAGTLPLQVQPVPVLLLFAEVKAQFATAIAESNIAVEFDVEERLPSLLVDYEHIGRVLYNLFDNAMKFTPNNGRIRLWARLDHTRTPVALLVGISDTGSGIAPEMQEKLFEKFRHGQQQGRRKGSGLGLAYCKLVVSAHDGDIWLDNESTPEEGATIVMRLPVALERISLVEEPPPLFAAEQTPQDGKDEQIGAGEEPKHGRKADIVR